MILLGVVGPRQPVVPVFATLQGRYAKKPQNSVISVLAVVEQGTCMDVGDLLNIAHADEIGQRQAWLGVPGKAWETEYSRPPTLYIPHTVPGCNSPQNPVVIRPPTSMPVLGSEYSAGKVTT